MKNLEKKQEAWKGIEMTERVTKEDILTFKHCNSLDARINALGMLAIAQAIDGLTHQLKRVIDTEMPPEVVKPKFSRDC